MEELKWEKEGILEIGFRSLLAILVLFELKLAFSVSSGLTTLISIEQ